MKWKVKTKTLAMSKTPVTHIFFQNSEFVKLKLGLSQAQNLLPGNP